MGMVLSAPDSSELESASSPASTSDNTSDLSLLLCSTAEASALPSVSIQLPSKKKNEMENRFVLEKILQMQQEIATINLHEREHITDLGELKIIVDNCAYCQVHLGHATRAPSKGRPSRNAVSSELERTACAAGKTAHVAVPRNWAGKRVRIVLLDG